MSHLELLKYIASYDDVPLEYGNAEKHRYTLGLDREITFNPMQWLCNNIKSIHTNPESSVLLNTKSNIECPKEFSFKDISLISNSVVNEENVCLVYIKYREELSTDCTFDSELYYCHFHELIGEKTKTFSFYSEYGYWYGLETPAFTGLTYIASYIEKINTIGVDETKAKIDFYENPKPIIFCPYVYIANNYENLEHFVNCIGEIDTLRVTKHYIRKGHKEKRSILKFDKYTYLSNHPSRITEICLNKKGKIDYSVLKLSTTNVAKNFIKHKGKQTKLFDKVKFTKVFVDDISKKGVNCDNKLCLENASEYFVNFFVKRKKVRHTTKNMYKILKFIYERLKDAPKTMPYSLLSYIIQIKYL